MNRESSVFQDYSLLIDPRIKSTKIDIVAAGDGGGDDSIDLGDAGVNNNRAR